MMDRLVHQIFHHRCFIAARKLRAPEAVLPRFQRKLTSLDFHEPEPRKETADVGERKDRMQAAFASFRLERLHNRTACTPALRLRINRKRPNLTRSWCIKMKRAASHQRVTAECQDEIPNIL